MMAIEMAGGVYCPLSPRDPQHRFKQLMEQSDTPVILVHWVTKRKFSSNRAFFETNQLVINYIVDSKLDIDQLTNIVLMESNITYIVVTSGSTGSPKAVSIIESYYYEDYSPMYARFK